MNAPKKNLEALDVRTAELFEARIANIKEMAYLLFSASVKRGEPALDTNWIRNIKKAYTEARDGVLWQGIEENRNLLKELSLSVGNIELAELALAIKELAEDGKDDLVPPFFYEIGEETPTSALGKVACIKNLYTDTAYSRFSAFLQNPSAVYYDSFSALCEDTGAGRCEYCILPIENSDDGKLMSFYKLLALNDLKIVLTTRVALSNDAKSTSFALAKKGIGNPIKAWESKTERYFEFCLVTDGGANISDVCAAARFFGIKLHRIDSSARTYSENEFEYYIVLDVSRGNIFSFLIYLSLKLGYYDTVGLYTKII